METITIEGVLAEIGFTVHHPTLATRSEALYTLIQGDDGKFYHVTYGKIFNAFSNDSIGDSYKRLAQRLRSRVIATVTPFKINEKLQIYRAIYEPALIDNETERLESHAASSALSSH